jgi:hypothetical protein
MCVCVCVCACMCVRVCVCVCARPSYLEAAVTLAARAPPVADRAVASLVLINDSVPIVDEPHLVAVHKRINHQPSNGKRERVRATNVHFTRSVRGVSNEACVPPNRFAAGYPLRGFQAFAFEARVCRVINHPDVDLWVRVVCSHLISQRVRAGALDVDERQGGVQRLCPAAFWLPTFVSSNELRLARHCINLAPVHSRGTRELLTHDSIRVWARPRKHTRVCNK